MRPQPVVRGCTPIMSFSIEKRDCMKRLTWTLFLLLLSSGFAIAHVDEPDLKLNQVKSVQVSYNISAYPEVSPSAKEIEDQFKNVLAQNKIKIDQNNYDNVVGTSIEIAKQPMVNGLPVYAVKMSFHYSETCHVPRLGIKSSCELWGRYELLKTFTNTDDVKKYVSDNVTAAVSDFAEHLRSK